MRTGGEYRQGRVGGREERQALGGSLSLTEWLGRTHAFGTVTTWEGRTFFKVWQPGRCVCVRGSEEKGEAEGEGGCGGCSVKYPVDVWSEGVWGM